MCIRDSSCFTEKQLDECDLTLRDLNEIGRAFTHILLGIYHQRIEYQKNGTAKEKPGGDTVFQSPSLKEDSALGAQEETGKVTAAAPQESGEPKKARQS
jgi:hypothetical protein